MELTIGIRDGAAPLTIEVDITKEALKSQIVAALTSGTVLELTGSDGASIIIPARSLGYIRLTQEEQRRVGFGFI
ncbi:DUF3107 domain-containing protein [Arcanobacterium hippocoleae]